MDLRDHQVTVVNADEVGVSAFDLQRLAIQIAEGHLTIPADLDGEQAERLARLVRDLRREQLVSYLARQIAIYVAGRREVKRKGLNHVEVGL